MTITAELHAAGSGLAAVVTIPGFASDGTAQLRNKKYASAAHKVTRSTSFPANGGPSGEKTSTL